MALSQFNPVKFSIEENEFLLAHIGEPPLVAIRSIPDKVNMRAVRPILDRVYELDQLEQHSGLIWAGVDAIKASIQAYLAQAEKWRQDTRRGAPRFPSMYSFDGRNKAHKYGTGSDAGEVKSYFDPTGKRIPFAVELIDAEAPDWQPDWAATQAGTDPPQAGLKVEADKSRIECQICGHTEQFKAESRGSFNAARARMSKHLRSADKEVEAHRELHTNEFGS